MANQGIASKGKSMNRIYLYPRGYELIWYYADGTEIDGMTGEVLVEASKTSGAAVSNRATSEHNAPKEVS